MTRKKKGLKRKPVVRRVGTKEVKWSRVDSPTNWNPDPSSGVVPLYPSLRSRVVGWVRENPLDAAIAFLGFAVAGGIVAVLVRG